MLIACVLLQKNLHEDDNSIDFDQCVFYSNGRQIFAFENVFGGNTMKKLTLNGNWKLKIPGKGLSIMT